MFNSTSKEVIIFLLSVFVLILLLGTFLVVLAFKHQKKGLAYNREIEELKVKYENTLLQSQLEVQEQTFQHIAREIHDNIGQKLTLAKLYLNTIPYNDINATRLSVKDSLELITNSISSLSDVSRSMGTEILLNNGLIKAIDFELAKMEKTGLYQCHLSIEGTEVFLNNNTEVVIFRIVQECINNFLKHAGGNNLAINMAYTATELSLTVIDNGKGIGTERVATGTGLANIKKRAALLNGSSHIESSSNGTHINIKIPINENTKQANYYIGR